MDKEEDKRTIAIYTDKDLVSDLDFVAEKNSRTRSGQALHYIKSSLKNERDA